MLYGLNRLDSLIDPQASLSKLICFVGEGGGASPGPAASDPPGGTSGSPQTPNGGGSQDSGDGGNKDADESEVQKAVNKAAAGIKAQMKRSYGGLDPEEVKAQLAELAEIKRSQLTAEQKAQADKEAAERERDDAAAEARQLRIENALHKHLASDPKLQPYLGKEDWILPKVVQLLGNKQVNPDNVQKAVKEATDEFVAAVPLAPVGDRTPGATPGPPRNGTSPDAVSGLVSTEAAGYFAGAGFTNRPR